MNVSETTVTALVARLSLLKKEIQKVIVGQDDIIEEILVALMAGGHCLLEGVPGLAKTLLVRTLAQALDLPFKRIQFTPDLMPADIIGTEILEDEDNQPGKRHFRFISGPLFANIILADEINRTPPKTQSALLEAMQEFEVTYAGKTYSLDKPFFILATQNPIEQAGTYPLPEAQLDRFLLYIKIGYPAAEEEVQILRNTTGTKKEHVEAIIGGSDIQQLQQLVREVEMSDQLIAHVSALVRATRPGDGALPYVNDWVQWGAGPRAGQALILTAKARALLHGRFAAIPEDIHQMAFPVLRHRVLMNFAAESEKITSDELTKELISILGKKLS
ncbi:AAA family ATPase [Parapedobacter sp. DT-150]|uniref:AAA family ATPase n=1 Tax=Parapedobacter sp. DT-150 TaxID=3396162 RepID=UPI003F1A964D